MLRSQNSVSSSLPGNAGDTPVCPVPPEVPPTAASPQADVPEAPITVAGENGVLIGHSVKNDVSPALRDLAPLPGEPWTKIREMPEPKGEDQNTIVPSPPVADPVLQSTFGEFMLNMPSPLVNINGVGNIDGVYPPDTNGDVGPNHYVQWVNLHFQIFNKSGASVYGPAAGNTLWSGFGGPCRPRTLATPSSSTTPRPTAG